MKYTNIGQKQVDFWDFLGNVFFFFWGGLCSSVLCFVLPLQSMKKTGMVHLPMIADEMTS